ncbi:MAG TPA: tetratricopeptide repeat protein, partial [Acidimicrobiales bacterium]
SLYRLFVEEGNDAEAARAAVMTAMYLMMDTGLMAPVRGWLRRAERLLAGRDDSPVRALLALTRTYERFMCGDMDAASEHAALAIELGERLNVPPAAIVGRVAAARVGIATGRVHEGLDELSEVGALVMSGDVDPLTAGMVYCELICAAQGLGRYDLAREWTDAMTRWCPGAAFGGIRGRCRVHRAEMLRVSGPCDAAETEALGACDELRPWMRREFGWPLAELGTIRLRKGDLAGAHEAFVAAHRHAWTPHPGLALVHLERGDVATAAVLIQDAIDHPLEVPSKERPPFIDLRLAPLLDAQVEIAAAAGDAGTARQAATRLRSIADRWDSDALHASAELAAARVAMLDGDFAQAIEHAARAVAHWTEIGSPFDAAVARVVLGDAHQRLGRATQARLEWEASLAAFEDYGAARWVERVRRLLAPAAEPPTSTTVARRASVTTATFRCDGGVRTLSFEGHTALVRDLKGMRYLERLLAEPGREFHVLDMVATEAGTWPAGTDDLTSATNRTASGAIPVLDEQARDAYRRRLAEVEDDIEEARRNNDVVRLQLSENERDFLVAELKHAVGLAGRLRSVGSDAERARTAVTRSIRYALERIDPHHPTLAAHLRQAINTGTYCSYTPDPRAPIVWQTTRTGAT